jgi:putative flippase GtrA
MLDARFLKFLLVGGINTLFGYGVYVVLLKAGLHYALASFFSTTAGVLFNFKTTGRLVFRSRDNTLLARFIGVYVLIYGVNVGCLKVCRLLDMDMFLAGAILVLPLALLSFVLNKKYVFIRSGPPGAAVP